MTWPFGNLSMFGYDMIMCDPPWSYENWSAKGERKNAAAKYDCMDVAEIKALPVGHLARQDAILMLWATNPMLDVAFDVLRAWGFAFKTAGHWTKRTVRGKLSFGTGYILRCAGEPFLISTVGAPVTSRSCRSVIEGLARQHSRKPDEAYAWAEKLMPGARRVDLFSRQTRPGWESWGNQRGLFDGQKNVEFKGRPLLRRAQLDDGAAGCR